MDKESKQELTQSIDNFHKGYVPLLAPLTLINHYLLEFPDPFLNKQMYLKPFPLELGIYAWLTRQLSGQIKTGDAVRHPFLFSSYSS